MKHHYPGCQGGPDCNCDEREIEENEALAAMPCSPKIVQILLTPNDNNWQGMLLGLGSDGVTYMNHNGDGWIAWIPAITQQENSQEQERR